MGRRTDAARAGLRHVCDGRTPGIRRLGSPGRFRYVRADGRKVSSRADLARITSLVIPPAWTDVWICPDPSGHLQATGRDARGRKQYRYHPRFRKVREEVKYSRLPAFAQALRRIRRRTAADLRKKGLPRDKVLAAAVQLLEKTLIRIGNEEYARANGSVGLTTMRDRHATIQGSAVRFEFRGKSGVAHAVELHDARLARIIKACRDLPGYEFARLARFRSQTEAKRNVMRAVESVAQRLGNTKTVCRKCYIHPAILDAYMDGRPMATDEAGVAAMIADV